MIVQIYRAGDKMVKVTIEGHEVVIFDANLARKGVSAETILARDKEKMEEWNKFMGNNPTEVEIAKEHFIYG